MNLLSSRTWAALGAAAGIGSFGSATIAASGGQTEAAAWAAAVGVVTLFVVSTYLVARVGTEIESLRSPTAFVAVGYLAIYVLLGASLTLFAVGSEASLAVGGFGGIVVLYLLAVIAAASWMKARDGGADEVDSGGDPA